MPSIIFKSRFKILPLIIPLLGIIFSFQNCSGRQSIQSAQLSSSEFVEQKISPISTQSYYALFPAVTLDVSESITFQSLSLVFQADGNLVMYRDGRALWNSETSGRNCSSSCQASFQGDGNLVLYQNGSPYWNSRTSGYSGAQLKISQIPPYLSIYHNQKTIWGGLLGLNWFTALDNVADYGVRPGAPDYFNLFSANAPWQNSLRHIQVFKIYSQFLQRASDAELVTLFTFLRNNNIALAMEHGPLNRGNRNCGLGVEGYGGVSEVPFYAQKIKSNGGELAFIALDEPMYYGHYKTVGGIAPNISCEFSIPELAQNVALTYEAYRREFPFVMVGDIEPFFAMPSTGWATKYAQFLDLYKQATDVSMAFVHDDAEVESIHWQQKISSIHSLLNQRLIPYGVIRNGTSYATSNKQWIDSAISRINTYKELRLQTPAHNIFQTWVAYPTHVLPETDSTTLTYLSNWYFTQFLAPVPTPPTPAPSLVQIYRLFKGGDFLYSQSQTEGVSAGYVLNGPAFKLSTVASSNHVPIYRCMAGAIHFLSLSSTCEGQRVEGLIGYASRVAGPPFRLYRFRNPANGTNLSTTNLNEGINAGFTLEAELGFVW